MSAVKTALFIVILPLSLSFSCGKGDSATDATINIITPTANDTLAFGEELHVEGTIKGNGVLEGYTFSIRNTSSGNYIVPETTVSDHEDSYVLHEHWSNNVSDTSVLDISIDVTLNADGNKKSKKVSVVCLPQ